MAHMGLHKIVSHFTCFVLKKTTFVNCKIVFSSTDDCQIFDEILYLTLPSYVLFRAQENKLIVLPYGQGKSFSCWFAVQPPSLDSLSLCLKNLSTK